MTKRVILPATLAALTFVWSGAAHASGTTQDAADSAKKAANTGAKAADDASDAVNDATKAGKKASKDAANATKSATDAATTSTDEQVGKAMRESQDASGRASSSVDRSASDATTTTTSTVETTSANMFAAEQPVRSGPNKKLLYGSAGLLALSYVPAAITGLASPKGSDSWMVVPVVGPWIALGEGSANRPWTGDVAIAADGVIQGVAAVGIVAALAMPESKMPLGMNSKLHVAPTKIGVGGYGVGAGGTF